MILVPAFNEEKTVGAVIDQLHKNKPKNLDTEIIVINDGSSDNTQNEARKKKVRVLNHLLNRGLGGALGTGLAYAKTHDVDFVITFDADGQHNPHDIKKIIKPIILQKADLVIGSRLKKKQSMPPDRFLLNWFANIATFFLFGIFSTDSQSGLRAFSKKAIEAIEIRSDRMDFSSEILLEAKRNNLKIVEVPIRAIYTPYSRKKGQKNINALPIMARFLVKLFR